jgi:streptogramin lyase
MMPLIEHIALHTRHVPGFIDFMASDQEFIWSTNQDRLQKWSAETSTPLAEVTVPQAAGIPVVAFGAVWAASLAEQAIYKIDQHSHEILARIPTGLADLTGEFSLTASADAVWLVAAQGRLVKIEPVQNQVTGEIEVLPYSYNLSSSGDALWLSNTQNASVQRIDPALMQVTHCIQVDDKPWFLSATPEFVWTLNQTHGTLSKIDCTRCEVVATIQLPLLAQGDGGDIFADADRVWVRTTNLLLIEIDAQTNQILREIHHTRPAGSGAVMRCGQHIWVTAHDIDKVWILATG